MEQERMYLKKVKVEGDDRKPYFRLYKIMPKGEEWIEVGAFWPAKNVPGYSGTVKEGVTITKVADEKPWRRKPTDEHEDEFRQAMERDD